MFSGIVETTGSVGSLKKGKGNLHITVAAAFAKQTPLCAML